MIRQQHRDRGHRAEAGQHADERAQHRPEKGVEQVLQREGHAEAERQVVQQFHRSPPTCRPG
jgi:hypothetical protein